MDWENGDNRLKNSLQGFMTGRKGRNEKEVGMFDPQTRNLVSCTKVGRRKN